MEDGEGCVTLKGTGRAIDRTLQLATYFMGLGYGVKVRTGSLGVVDDVVELQEGFVKRDRGTGKKRKGKVAEEVEMAGKEEEVEEVEMVARTTSVVEVLIVRKKE